MSRTPRGRQRPTAAGALASRSPGRLPAQSYGYDVRRMGIGSLTSTTHPYAGACREAQLSTWEQRSATPSGAPADARARSKWAFPHDASGRRLAADSSTHNGTAYAATPDSDLGGLDYDGNGNLLRLLRNGAAHGSLPAAAIDALSYMYTSGTNRLVETTDAATSDRGAPYRYFGYDGDGVVVRIDGYHHGGDDDARLVLDRRKLPVTMQRLVDNTQGYQEVARSYY